MNLSDTFYVALCMTVLILGAVYWFWTQNQFMLRKLNLLENIVYEMKMAFSNSGGGSPFPAEHAGVSSDHPGLSGSATYAPAPGSVMSDDDVELLNEDLQGTLSSVPEEPLLQNSPVLEVTSNDIPMFTMPDVETDTPILASDDLQPGGVGSGVPEAKAGASAYDTMTLKELRRLADNRGISGAKDLRKQALIDALRNSSGGTTFDVTEGVLDLN